MKIYILPKLRWKPINVHISWFVSQVVGLKGAASYGGIRSRCLRHRLCLHVKAELNVNCRACRSSVVDSSDVCRSGNLYFRQTCFRGLAFRRTATRGLKDNSTKQFDCRIGLLILTHIMNSCAWAGHPEFFVLRHGWTGTIIDLQGGEGGTQICIASLL